MERSSFPVSSRSALIPCAAPLVLERLPVTTTKRGTVCGSLNQIHVEPQWRRFASPLRHLLRAGWGTLWLAMSRLAVLSRRPGVLNPASHSQDVHPSLRSTSVSTYGDRRCCDGMTCHCTRHAAGLDASQTQRAVVNLIDGPLAHVTVSGVSPSGSCGPRAGVRVNE